MTDSENKESKSKVLGLDINLEITKKNKKDTK